MITGTPYRSSMYGSSVLKTARRLSSLGRSAACSFCLHGNHLPVDQVLHGARHVLLPLPFPAPPFLPFFLFMGDLLFDVTNLPLPFFHPVLSLPEHGVCKRIQGLIPGNRI